MPAINMPRLSDSMEEGTVLKWLIEPGEKVAAGEDLVEIETDKATMTYQSESSGVLEVIVAEGDTIAVGEPIAHLADGSAAPSEQAEPATAVTLAERAEAPPSAPSAPAPSSSASSANGLGDGSQASATPLARRIAREHGLELGTLTGSGPRGRITKSDVLSAAGVTPEPPRQAPAAATAVVATSAQPAAASSRADGAKGESSLQPASRLQQIIARRMAEVKATVPDFQVEIEVAMDAAIALRSRLKEIAGEEPAPSFNDLVVKACGVALRQHPRANATYRNEAFELHSQINIGIAVAADEALVVPTIFDADRKSIGEIGRESRRLAERVRSGEVTPPELAGATFTVSNLGMFGTTGMTPIINLHQAAILGVGTMRDVLRRVDGEIVDSTLMTLRLSADHRILYGADAAQFLATVKDLLEEPLLLAL